MISQFEFTLAITQDNFNLNKFILVNLDIDGKSGL